MAADQGNSNAQVNLGHMYSGLSSLPKDPAQAIKWFRKAAEQGNVYGQSSLAGVYMEGEGIPKNYLEAYVWLLQAKAGALGEGMAKSYGARAEECESHLTKTQIAEGQRRATEAWNKRHANE
jgi:hypothetical protein